LIKHELRPFDYVVDTKQAVVDIRHSREPTHRSRPALAESSRLLSASPFRATVKLNQETHESQESDDEQFARET
jgi:hypothetical protein